MALVVKPVERPLDLIGVDNGKLDPALLVPVGPRGYLHHIAARAWLSLVRCAAAAGWSLTYTYGGCYRTYIEQELLFHQRYTRVPLPGQPSKLWQGEQWYLRPGMAMAAVPGTSNHGLGLAVDMALGADPAHATSIGPALDWLAEHAPRFGFSWEAVTPPTAEIWHIRYVTGDRVPQAVIDWEPHDPPPPAPLEDDMAIRLISESKGEWIWSPGGRPQPFKSPADRDAIIAAGKYASAPVTDVQLLALFADERPD